MTTTMEPQLDTPPAAEAQLAEPTAQKSARPARRDVYVDDPRRKSVMLASILSVMPGLGQAYVGYYPQAFTNIFVMCGVLALASTGAVDDRLGPPVAIFGIFFWLYNIVDAGRRASLYNQALVGLRPMELPEDGKGPAWPGSLAGGAALIAAGLVLFAHTKFGVPLDWLAQWWPIGLVGIGAWLIYQNRRTSHGRTD